MSIEIEERRVAATHNPEMDLLKSRMKEGTEKEKQLLTFLFNYADAMKGREDKGTEGAKWQTQLYQHYVHIIDQADQNDFRPLWSIVLLFAKLHKDTVYHADMINRYSHLWTMPEAKLTAFQLTNNLIRLTADPELRAVNIRRKVDLSKTLDKYYTEEGVQRVIAYYKG